MEKVVDHIRLAKIKQESIPESFDQGHGEACSILSFDQLELSSKFSFLKHEKELDLKAKNIAETIRVLKQRDKEVELKSNEVEARIDCLQSESKLISSLSKWIQNFSVEVKSKERQLKLALKDIESRIKKSRLEQQKENEKCSKELTMKNLQLGIIEKSIEQQNEEFNSNEKKFGSVRMKLELCCKNLSVKSKQLESVEELLQVRRKEFELKEKEVANEIELKQMELTMKTNQLSTVERSIEEHVGKLKSEDMKLLRVKDELKKCCQDLSVKTKQLESVQKELEVIEKEAEKVKTFATNCNEELELKQKHFISDSNSELELKQNQKQNQLEMLQGLANVRSTELDFKVKTPSGIEKSVEKCQNELNLKMKDRLSIENSITECELDSKKNLDLVNISLKECSEELESKKKNLELVKISLKDCCNNLTSKEAEFDSLQRKICGLHTELKEREKHFDSLKTTLEERSRKLEMKEKQFEACLKEFELKEQRTRANCQNRQALEPYDMDDNDLLPNDVAALESSADPAMFILDVIRYSQRKGLDASVKTKILLMEKLIEISPRISDVVKAEARKLAVSWKANLILGSEKLIEVWAFLLFLASYRLMYYFGEEEILKLVLVVAAMRKTPDLCRVLDFTHKIPEIIEILIERKQHTDAARFTIAFGLLNGFPLQLILQNCFEHIKGKAIDEELSVLNAVLQCLMDYKLNSRIETESTLRRIIELEKEREFCRRAASIAHASFNAQEQHLVFGGNSKRAKTGTS